VNLFGHSNLALSFLLVLTLKTTLLLTLAWIVERALRGRSAALRHRVWALGIVGALALPFLTTLLPAWRLGTLANAAVHVEIAPGAAGAGTTRVSIVANPASSVPWPSKLIGVALALWALGSLLIVLKLLAGVVRLLWLTSRSKPMFEENWLRALAGLSESFGVDRPVRVLQCASPAAMPLTWGVLRPRIVLPDGAAEWAEERRRIVLSHELAHIRRHDWLLQISAELLRGLYWFHPLAWIAADRLRQESERACDDLVLNSGIEAPEYASQLVALARTLKSPGHRLSVALAIARPSNLERRFASMLNPSLDRGALSRKAGALAVLLGLCLLLPLAALRLPAQALSGDFTGTIRDASGAIVPDGAITMTNQTADTVDTAKSDAAGNFTFAALPAGEYTLRVEKAGFRAYTAPITLEAGRALSLKIKLSVGSTSQHVTVEAAGSPTAPLTAESAPSQLSVGGNVGEAKIISRAPPVYPAAAQAAGIEGDVIMHAIIGKDGNLLSLHVINSRQVDPELARAAIEAVSQWRYLPTQLNGNPIETDTTITVSFHLR
jgi:TonB family protein